MLKHFCPRRHPVWHSFVSVTPSLRGRLKNLLWLTWCYFCNRASVSLDLLCFIVFQRQVRQQSSVLEIFQAALPTLNSKESTLLHNVHECMKSFRWIFPMTEADFFVEIHLPITALFCVFFLRCCWWRLLLLVWLISWLISFSIRCLCISCSKSEMSTSSSKCCLDLEAEYWQNVEEIRMMELF